MFLRNKMLLFLVIIIFVIIASLVLWVYLIRYKEIVYKYGNVCVNENCFKVEIAKNFLEQYRGLMFRDNLLENKGMLFVFDKEAIYPFWMKNTKIPLDIIWINSDNKIVYIFEFAQPCLPAGRQAKLFFCPKINPNIKANYVLEINAGLSQELNIKTGDIVKISK